MKPLRSFLFVPGNRRDMLEKSISFTADVLVPDMEDSVPDAEKSAARNEIANILPRLAEAGHQSVVRVNALDTGLLEEDMRAAVTPHTYGINVGKVESPWDVMEVDRIVGAIEAKQGMEIGSTRLVLFIESAMAVVNAYAICASSPRIVAVALGGEDFTVDMGTQRTEEGTEIFVPRAMVAMAATAANVVPVDIVYTNFRDEEGLKRDIQLGKSLGYKGKFAIHPGQVATINQRFSPLPEEIEHAMKVVAAFEEAEAQGRGATSLDGKMIDVPIVKRARSLLARVEVPADGAPSDG